MGELWRRLVAFLLRPRLDRELDEEMRTHREMKLADHLAAGADREQARYRTAREFGNATLWKESSREMWSFNWFETLWQNVRFGVRILARSPGFTSVAVLSLALGIGANTAIFSLMDNIALRFLPVKNPQELVLLSSRFSYPRFEQLRDRNEVFSGIFAASGLERINVDGSSEESQQAVGRLVSGSYFSILGVPALIGRALTADDDRVPGGHPVVVISYGFWKRKYGADPAVIGRTVRLGSGAIATGAGTGGFESAASKVVGLEGTAFTIIGVTPREFFGDIVGLYPDFWVPLMMQESLMPGRPWLTRKTANWLQLMARLKPNTTEQQAAAGLTVLNQQIQTDEEGADLTEQRRKEILQQRVNMQPGAKGFSTLRGQFSQPLQILMGMVALVLLIACANLANLLLARATARRREIGVRLAIGASRRRLIHQLFTESLLLALAGGILGVLVGSWGGSVLLAMATEGSASARLNLTPDLRILGFTGAVSLLTALIFGLAPAFRATRMDLVAAMREGGGERRRRLPVAKMLVVTQVALSVVLLVGAGLFVGTLRNLYEQELGYGSDHIMIMRVDPITAGYRGTQISNVCRQLLERLGSLPGVHGATFSENGLFSGTESGAQIEVEGFTPKGPRDRSARFDQIGPDYFETVGIPILLGRGIGVRDTENAPRVTVINQTMARFYFQDANPVGRHISYRASPTEVYSIEIVGVSGDARDHNLRSELVRRFYVPFYQPIDGITTANYEVRTPLDPNTMAAQLRREVAAVDPKIPVLRVKALETLIDETLVQERLIAKLAGVFGALALLLASVGLYGVMAYAVVRRTREIGIRMAVGAQPGEALGLVLRETLWLALGGIAVGVPAALGATRLVGTLLFGLKPNDPLTIAIAALVMLIIALAAGFLPARRASRIDPMLALRYE